MFYFVFDEICISRNLYFEAYNMFWSKKRIKNMTNNFSVKEIGPETTSSISGNLPNVCNGIVIFSSTLQGRVIVNCEIRIGSGSSRSMFIMGLLLRWAEDQGHGAPGGEGTLLLLPRRCWPISYAMLSYVMLCCAMLCYAMLWCSYAIIAMLCYHMLCYDWMLKEVRRGHVVMKALMRWLWVICCIFTDDEKAELCFKCDDMLEMRVVLWWCVGGQSVREVVLWWWNVEAKVLVVNAMWWYVSSVVMRVWWWGICIVYVSAWWGFSPQPLSLQG